MVAFALLARRAIPAAPVFVASVRSEMARLRRRESDLAAASAALGVRAGADAASVRAAYRDRARECHPDLHPGNPDALGSFVAVTAAKGLLLDPPPLIPRRAPRDSG